ncbi:hypothetical protein SLS61_000833 [Didymella pomorum]
MSYSYVEIVSIFAVNAPVINALLKVDTWTSTDASCKCTHPSCFRHIHSAQQDDSAVPSKWRRAEDFDFKMIDVETQSKNSTSELVKGLNPEISTTSWTANVQCK